MVLVRMVPVLVHARKRTFSMTKTTISNTKDGTGAVEYLRYEDMKYALKKLDDTKFRSHEVNLSLVLFVEATF